MASKRKSLPSSRANEFISNALLRGKWPGDAPFVSIENLADMAGVSLVTMWKAVGDARAKGLVNVVRRKGVCIRTAIEKKPEPQLQDMVSRSIERDIISGVFQPGSRLPSRKELTARYSVSHVTLGRALQSLCDNTILIRSGRWYASAPIRGSVTTAQKARIAVLARKNELGLPQFGIKQSDLLHILEHTAAQNGIALDIVTYSVKGSALRFASFPGRKKYDIHRRSPVLGFVVFHVLEREKHYKMLFDALCRTKHPVAVIDEIGMRPFELPAVGARHVNVFSVADSHRAVMQVARYCISLGHKSFAYVSPFHASAWSKNRLEAMQSALVQAGIRTPVKTLTLDNFKTRLDILEKLQAETVSLKKAFSQWKKTVAPEYYRYTASIADYEASYSLPRGFIRRQFDRKIKSLLADTSVTACVAANDMTAAILLDCLEKKKIAMPGRMAIVSFDNEASARNRGITSYDFNLHGMMNAAIMSILRPEAYRRSNPNRISEIEGFIVERESTRAHAVD